MVDFSDITGTTASLLVIEFQKAFNSVRWNSITDALKMFGFGERFVRWINVIYKNIFTCIANNGFHSNWFKPARGTRQRYCLSPYLFLIVLETLAIAVREYKNIREYLLVGEKNLYADDVTCFLEDRDSLH